MPYIGNQPADRFGSLVYQDLTGVTGSPVKRGFTLNQAVANEMELEVFVNNVRQEPTDAYTVSGTTLTMTGDVETTDDFYVVFQGKAIGTVTHPSNTPIVATTGTFSSNVDVGGSLLVDTIKDGANTNTAMTIDSSGRVTMANTVEIDIWRLASSFTTNADITGWERSDNATSGYAGTGMTESSGVFTFPSTGLWKVSGCFLITAVSGDTSAGLVTQVSTDSGSSFATTGGCFESQHENTSAAIQTMINVTNASTFRFKLVASGLNSGSSIVGNTSRDYSTLIFERITDAQ